MQSLLGSRRPQGYPRVEKPLPLPSPFPDPIPETSFSLTSPASHSTAALHRRSTVQDCSTAPTASATTARPPLRLSAPQQWASPRAPCHPPALGPARHVEDSRLLSVWDSRSLSPTRLGDIPAPTAPDSSPSQLPQRQDPVQVPEGGVWQLPGRTPSPQPAGPRGAAARREGWRLGPGRPLKDTQTAS